MADTLLRAAAETSRL